MDTTKKVDKEALTRGQSSLLLNQAGIQYNVRARVTKEPVAKWDMDCEAVVVGNQAGKKNSVMDLGQDSSVLCLQISTKDLAPCMEHLAFTE